MSVELRLYGSLPRIVDIYCVRANIERQILKAKTKLLEYDQGYFEKYKRKKEESNRICMNINKQ